MAVHVRFIRISRLEMVDLVSQYQNFLLKRNRVRGVHYQGPDADFDAWMIVCGEERLAFNRNGLRELYPGTDYETIARALQEKLDIRKL